MTTPDPFSFTVTDVARFLDKSAVTLRGWEKRGLLSFPRNEGGDRKLSVADVRKVAKTARQLGRINENRLQLVEAALTMISLIEEKNK